MSIFLITYDIAIIYLLYRSFIIKSYKILQIIYKLYLTF